MVDLLLTFSPARLSLRFRRECGSSLLSYLHAQRSLCVFILGRCFSLSVRVRCSLASDSDRWRVQNGFARGFATGHTRQPDSYRRQS